MSLPHCAEAPDDQCKDIRSLLCLDPPFLMLLLEMFMSCAYLIFVMDTRHMRDFTQDVLREVPCIISIVSHILETENHQ
jgi:hypothetical protein